MALYRTINKVRHTVYESEKEFRSAHPDEVITVKWRDGTEDDWVFTDTGEIAQVLKRSTIHSQTDGRPQTYVRTPIGTFLTESASFMDGVFRENLYSFSGNPPRDRAQATRRERLFALYISTGASPADAYMRSFRTNNREYATRRAFFILRSDRVKQAIYEEIRAAADGIDLTIEEVLIGMRKIANDEKGAKPKDRIDAWDRIADYIGMKQKEQTGPPADAGGVFAGFLAMESRTALPEGGRVELPEESSDSTPD